MSLSHHLDSVQYDRARGVLLLSSTNGSRPTEYADVTTVADAITTGAIKESLLPVVAAYTLALVAHQHSGWPTESRRASLIQVAEQLRNACPSSEALNQMLDNAIARANDSLLRGETDVEAVLVDVAEGRMPL